jgi:DNA polymerase sigma
MPQNSYLNTSSAGTSQSWTDGTTATISTWGGAVVYQTPECEVRIEPGNQKGKISPQLYFTYIKKKFSFLERTKLDRRLERINKAFDEAMENGQNFLAEKILTDLAREMKESIIVAKGITEYIEHEDLIRHKHNIKEGHISDTLVKDYTRVIPTPVAEKMRKLKGVFDNFVIWHYYEEKLEKKREKKQKMSPEEKGKMRDPILFGLIKETDRLYFIMDWEDKYCDLTFDEIVDVMGSKRISKNPQIGKKDC